MTRETPRRRVPRDEAGYALVLIMFFLALLVLSTVVAAPTIVSSIQREREAEMVWRGKQYTRGIRMYYLRMRRFPTSLDDLTTAKNNMRFMRKAYKDPMNTQDGSWRLIYVGPNGQLIGSLNMQFLGMQATGGAPNGTVQNTAFGGSTGSFGTSFSTSASGGNANAGAANANPVQGNSADGSSNDPNAQSGDTSSQIGQPHPLNNTMDASNTIGGNIIGVGSKVNKKSFMWYQKAKDYLHFEFIWDPTKDVGMGAASRGIGIPVQNMNGAPGMNAPGTQQNPQQNPPQNPQQSQPLNPNPGGGGDMPLQAPPPNQ